MIIFSIILCIIGLCCIAIYHSGQKTKNYQKALKQWEYAMKQKAKEHGYDLNAKDGMYHTKILLLKDEVGDEPHLKEYL